MLTIELIDLVVIKYQLLPINSWRPSTTLQLNFHVMHKQLQPLILPPFYTQPLNYKELE